MHIDLYMIKSALEDIDERLETNLKDSFIESMTSYFSMLLFSDKKKKDDEINYINKALDISLDKSSVKKIKMEKKLPQIITDLMDIVYDDKSISWRVLSTIDKILEAMEKLGLEILSADDKLSQSELSLYTKYISYVKSETKMHTNIIADVISEDYDYDEEELKEDEEESLDILLDKLNSLVGLKEVKDEINSTINLIRVRKLREERGFNNLPMSYHMVFTGNPGTGKTTVARLLSKIYKSLGLLSSGHLVETDRSGLVAGYIGQTAIKTKEVLESALGGILFIDEAYSLTQSRGESDYGREAIDTIVKFMEDNRDDLIVIAAGYPKPMEEFVSANPGLKSRFSKFIEFENYNSEELYKIFEGIADSNNYIVDLKAKEIIIESLESLDYKQICEFGNARGVRNLFERIVTNQASRIVSIKSPTDEDLITITKEDIKAI